MFNESNERVTMVVHSTGGPVSLYFLNNVVNQEWKDQYINAYIPIAAPFAGVFIALSSILLGNPSIQHYAGGQDSRATSRSLPSLNWILPSPSVWGETVIINMPTKNYTAYEYKKIFEDFGHTNGYHMYMDTVNINRGFPAPNVTVHCVYGTGVTTPIGFTYVNDVSPVEFRNGDGDGMAEVHSTAAICLKWQKEQHKNVSKQVVRGGQHVTMLNDINVLRVSVDLSGLYIVRCMLPKHYSVCVQLAIICCKMVTDM